MLLLHIGIAISNYTGLNFNIKGVNAKDWFIFAGSYLGGVLTLGGVVLTIKNERRVHQHQIKMDEIRKEKEILVNAVSNLDVYSVSIFYNFFLDFLETENCNNNFAELYKRIFETQKDLNTQKIIVHANTDVFSLAQSQCVGCKAPCGLPKVCEQFSETYDRVFHDIYGNLTFLYTYITEYEKNLQIDENIIKRQSENTQKLSEFPENKNLKKQKYDVSQYDIKLREAMQRMSKYVLRELPQLIGYIKAYESIRIKNVDRKCFPENNILP